MAKKPLENLYLNGDGYATKKELRAALAKAHITGVSPETNAILEVFQVDEINTDDVSENVRGICAGKGINFINRGGFEMKGFSEPPILYEVEWRI